MAFHARAARWGSAVGGGTAECRSRTMLLRPAVRYAQSTPPCTAQLQRAGGACRPAQLRPLVRLRPAALVQEAWAVNADQLPATLFAASLLPWLVFLFFVRRAGLPRVSVTGFFFLLLFVGATIPAGIYAKQHYGHILADVDSLHGAAESLLTITNLLVLFGLSRAVRGYGDGKDGQGKR